MAGRDTARSLNGETKQMTQNVIISNTPVEVAVHFKNHAARMRAGRVLEKSKLNIDVITMKELDAILTPYVNRVPIYRAAPASMIQARRRATARAAAKEKADAIKDAKKPDQSDKEKPDGEPIQE